MFQRAKRSSVPAVSQPWRLAAPAPRPARFRETTLFAVDPPRTVLSVVERVKYPAQFSSPVRKVPQGVLPVPQLLMVPRQSVPPGENFVFIRADPRAGPWMRIGVSGVT